MGTVHADILQVVVETGITVLLISLTNYRRHSTPRTQESRTVKPHNPPAAILPKASKNPLAHLRHSYGMVRQTDGGCVCLASSHCTKRTPCITAQSKQPITGELLKLHHKISIVSTPSPSSPNTPLSNRLQKLQSYFEERRVRKRRGLAGTTTMRRPCRRLLLSLPRLA